ncbi:MAG: HWE histidine kinase domain-containing protein [Candidatus Binatia bacterium]
MTPEKSNILLVDDHPAKLLTYETILQDLGENLINADSARSAFEHLLKRDIAVALLDVCMPELDGFELAKMIREHPRCKKTAIIFISGIYLSDDDRLRGYELGAVDYVQVPVIPEVLRSKVKIFVDLHRKTRQLEQLNRELENRVAERTVELAASNARLIQSERSRELALAAGQMGTWEWDIVNGQGRFDEGQCRIFGVDPKSFEVTIESVRALVHPEDWDRLVQAWAQVTKDTMSFQTEFRLCRHDGELRYCIGTAAASIEGGRIVRMSGVTVDITKQKEAENRQVMLAREVDHRAMNMLTVVQSIVHLTRAKDIASYAAAVESRIRALAQAHVLLSRSRWQEAELKKLVEEELAPYYDAHDPDKVMTIGPNVLLEPTTAQTLALALHELATNAAKYGALSAPLGRVRFAWNVQPESVELHWQESGGPAVEAPATKGFGTRVISAIIEGQLGGEATFDWRREGLQCTISIPRPDAFKSGEQPPGMEQPSFQS